MKLFIDTPALLATDGERQLTLPELGIGTIAAGFRSTPPAPVEWENAIMPIEDTIMAHFTRTAASTLHAGGPFMQQLAAVTGQRTWTDTQIERLFERLAALSLGRPLSQETLPVDALFCAGVLLLRELMHHLGFTQLQSTADD